MWIEVVFPWWSERLELVNETTVINQSSSTLLVKVKVTLWQWFHWNVIRKNTRISIDYMLYNVRNSWSPRVVKKKIYIIIGRLLKSRLKKVIREAQYCYANILHQDLIVELYRVTKAWVFWYNRCLLWEMSQIDIQDLFDKSRWDDQLCIIMFIHVTLIVSFYFDQLQTISNFFGIKNMIIYHFYIYIARIA